MRALPAGIGQSVEYLIQSGSSSGEGSAACEWWVPAICLMGPLSHEKSHMAKLTARAGHGRSMTVSVEKGAVGGGSEGSRTPGANAVWSAPSPAPSCHHRRVGAAPGGVGGCSADLVEGLWVAAREANVAATAGDGVIGATEDRGEDRCDARHVDQLAPLPDVQAVVRD